MLNSFCNLFLEGKKVNGPEIKYRREILLHVVVL